MSKLGRRIIKSVKAALLLTEEEAVYAACSYAQNCLDYHKAALKRLKQLYKAGRITKPVYDKVKKRINDDIYSQ